ncbi:hypothetical protein BEL04_08140 [Mucilaginibacter sp. PPCGB 2223]|uniref:hypothetical protein n=1 Tax=Mucilaginibacter sp. PPCGB 2223 TaxID=1886027 RepID=UPI0008264AC3|nr:hypothetical protein [Mucilaginibacter sp. PPCGB 2223]OCX54219.1 hypothetical protein BEL04_08140 [Mucilaginibacter sp. PPCGB 2223]
MDKSLEDKIRAEIKKSGFPLELELTEKLRNEDNVLVFSNITFQNGEKSIRELDVVAIFQDQDNEWSNGPVGSQLLIECKKTDKYPWVFFEEVYDPLTILGIVQKIDYSTDLKIEGRGSVLIGGANTELNQHFYDDINISKARTYFEALKGSNDSTIYKAVMNIFQGRKYLKELFSRQYENRIVHSDKARTFLRQYVIVLDGNLVLASKNTDDFDLQNVNHVILRSMDTDSKTSDYLFGDEVLIDVITREYFDTYVELTKKGLRHFTNHLNRVSKSNLLKIKPSK